MRKELFIKNEKRVDANKGHKWIEVFLVSYTLSHGYCVISSEKHSFDYSDEQGIQKWDWVYVSQFY